MKWKQRTATWLAPAACVAVMLVLAWGAAQTASAARAAKKAATTQPAAVKADPEAEPAAGAKPDRAAARAARRQSAEAGPKWPDDLKAQDHIVYKTVDGKPLELALFVPGEKRFEKAPLVVYIHGGGWGGGDRTRMLKAQLLEVIRGLLKNGIVCATIEYRLTVTGGPSAYESAADCKDAVRFFAKNAEKYGIDKQRIGTFGSSAGGHLTLVTALGDDKDYPCDPSLNDSGAVIRCVAAYYPATSFTDPQVVGGNFKSPNRLIPILGGPLEQKTDIAHKLNPLELVRKQSPAILLAHGEDDTTLLVKNSTVMRDAAAAKGVPVECIVVKGAGHGFSGETISPTIEEIDKKTLEFFLKYLRQ